MCVLPYSTVLPRHPPLALSVFHLDGLALTAVAVSCCGQTDFYLPGSAVSLCTVLNSSDMFLCGIWGDGCVGVGVGVGVNRTRDEN